MKNLVIFLLAFLLIYSCKNTSGSESSAEESEEVGEYIEYNNPPAEGFNQEDSDLLATLLADKVMNAMGGRQAWDETRFICWTFFGRRSHIWDKQTGNVRIEDPSRELTILMNINTLDGKVKIGEEELSNPDSLKKYLDFGLEAWINDSYWLVMPFKLKDSGVTLNYLGEDTTQTGTRADVIMLTFENVGVTPENMYYVWIDVDTKYVNQWSYYSSRESSEPDFITPWSDYAQYGSIQLSGNRGENRQLSDIKVLDDVPEGTFDLFEQTFL